ncbi:MAG TPA: hypothetical protein QKA37_00925 [Candidatus Megaira endosymbiont of Stentor roeselii]|nr:hypothetical protein [Candidatus Megaera endosymbiont of Stentor roeselii]
MINKYSSYSCRGLIAAIIIFISSIAIANPQNNFVDNIDEKTFSEIYFTNYNTENHHIKAYLDVQSHKIILSVNKKLNIKLNSNLPVKILELTPNRLIIFTRNIFQKGFKIIQLTLNEKMIEEISLPEAFQDYGYFRGAFFNGKYVYFVNYVPKNFNDSLIADEHGDLNILYRLSLLNDTAAFDNNFSINLGKDQDIRFGIDRVIHFASIDDNKLITCSGNYCNIINESNNFIEKIDLPKDFFILELKGNKTCAYGLLATNSKDSNPSYISYNLINKDISKNLGTTPVYEMYLDNNCHETFKTLNASNREEYLQHLIFRTKDSGLLEMGMDNDQARIAWSQVYYLNLFIDIVSPRFLNEFEFYSTEFKTKLKKRLNQEISLLNNYIKDGVKTVKTTRYSTKKQPRIYAVQTGRILRLLKRYDSTIATLPNLNKFRDEVENLIDHEEVLYQSNNTDIDNLSKGRISLKWPKGIDFPFDGFKIPFNHQDDWAAGVTYGNLYNKNNEIAKNIILTFLEKSGVREANLENYTWKYWYGRVAEKWTKDDNLSINTPIHPGDTGQADISYLTIDVMALLTVAKKYPELLTDKMFNQIKKAVQYGLLFPFVQEDLKELYNTEVNLTNNAVLKYLLCDSPWCIVNVGWALKDFK